MKKKHYLAIVSVVFILLCIVFFKTLNVKYVLLGIGLIFGGVVLLIDEIEHPTPTWIKNTFTKGEVAWLVCIISGIWLIVHYLRLMGENQIW